MQIPCLETPQGAIWESNAIARFVARLSDNGLFGETAIEAVSAMLMANLKNFAAA